MNQFKDHGKVTVYLYGFNASASTIISLGAKTVKMDKNGFYLVHKVSNWIGEWGTKNADEIQEAIDRLQKNKQENDKIDMVLAQLYAAKTGKDVQEMHDVLTKGTWLTAQEAKEYGFVDELVDASEKINFTPEMEEKFNAFGLPIPKFPEATTIPYLNSEEEELPNSIFDSLKNFFTQGKKNSKTDNEEYMSKTDLTHINEALGVTEIAIDKEKKAFFSEEELAKINKVLEELKSEKKTLLNEKETLTQQVESLKNADGDDTPPVDTTEDPEESAENGASEMYNAIKDLF